MTETSTDAFYCVRCQDRRESEGEVVTDDNGTRMAKMTCPVCGTQLSRILGTV